MSNLEDLEAQLEQLEAEKEELQERARQTWISLGEPPDKPKALTNEDQARLERLKKELIPELKNRIKQQREQ